MPGIEYDDRRPGKPNSCVGCVFVQVCVYCVPQWLPGSVWLCWSEGGQLVSFLQRQNKLCSASAQPVPRMVRLHICSPVCTYMMCTAVVSRHLQLLDCRCEVAQLCMHASKICACLLQLDVGSVHHTEQLRCGHGFCAPVSSWQSAAVVQHARLGPAACWMHRRGA